MSVSVPVKTRQFVQENRCPSHKLHRQPMQDLRKNSETKAFKKEKKFILKRIQGSQASKGQAGKNKKFLKIHIDS